jgi:hypothetical protein
MFFSFQSYFEFFKLFTKIFVPENTFFDSNIKISVTLLQLLFFPQGLLLLE